MLHTGTFSIVKLKDMVQVSEIISQNSKSFD